MRSDRYLSGLLLLAVAAGLLGAGAAVAPAGTTVPARATVRLVFAGDAMLGRGVARASAGDPAALLAGVRFPISSADLAIANLESPLTLRPHLAAAGRNALEAAPASARLLVAVGFDVVGVANNHAGDAGRGTVPDTLRALHAAGLRAVGGGLSAAEAYAPRLVRVGALRVALLAFDATGQGPRAGVASPGVAGWDEARARAAVARARAAADIVAVGVHGGAEYFATPGPAMLRITRLLASWDVDVVWGQGPHVVQPVTVVDPDGDGRPTVVAASLGNFVFDQHIPGTQQGALLEVLAGPDGARAYRVGATDQSDGAVRFTGWRAPAGDAVALAGAWWALARTVAPAAPVRPRVPATFRGDVVASALGDPDGDGRPDAVIAFRRPYSPTAVSELVARRRLVDSLGRSAHVGLYRPGDLRQRWVAGTLMRPAVAVAACDGALAVAYSTLDRPVVVATGAWRWGGFGFISLPDLPGPGRPGCADVNGDGRLDPLVLERKSP
jgi:poly-gamma-glutamate synthesis protein (capsule biosynthesis protein)